MLLDFWATWCGPCVAALDSFKKLHEQTAAKGLALLSIDEDEDAKTAADFWSRREMTWPDFHDDGEVWRSFPGSEGIPYYVLIDGDGQIVFSKTGAKDSALRAAIAKLGIDLPASQAASDTKAKQ
ncbi:MAG TPA: TlpA disulfide reductase family protein [Candidatus Angelobacter sp.]|nr:TlpA disulfide reductase family protein [Candidatus Angelobacter sp.]